MPELRIALVAPFGLRAKGTTARRVLPLAAELAGRGHSVAVFIPPYDSPQDAGRRWRLAVPQGQAEVIHAPLPGGSGRHALWHLRLALRLMRTVRQWQPDVVHAFKPKGPSGLVAAAMWAVRRARGCGASLAASRNLACPRLVVDADDWEGPGGWNDDPRAGYTRLQRAFFAWQERYGLAHAHAWTVASSCLRERAIGFGADPARVFVLPNGMPDGGAEADSAAPECIGGASGLASGRRLRPNGPVLLYTRFAGVLPENVAIIWLAVRAELPAAQLIIAGRGLSGEEKQLSPLPGVTVCGWVEPRDLQSLFAGSSVAMVPWTDAPANRARSSVKVRELMAAGLAIVATRVGELPEVLAGAGLLVPPGDMAALAAAVVALLRDPEQANALGQAAQDRAKAFFRWSRLAQAALDAYDTALA